MFEAIFALIFSLCIGEAPDAAIDYTTDGLTKEEYLEVGYAHDAKGLSYDEWKHAYLEALTAAKDGGGLDVLAAD